MQFKNNPPGERDRKLAKFAPPPNWVHFFLITEKDEFLIGYISEVL